MSLRLWPCRLWLFVLVSCQQVNPENQKGLRELAAPEVWKMSCARCHGPQGKGGPPIYPDTVAVRDLSDPVWQSLVQDQQLYDAVANGKDKMMPSFKLLYTKAQLLGVVQHIRSLNRAPPTRISRTSSVTKGFVE